MHDQYSYEQSTPAMLNAYNGYGMHDYHNNISHPHRTLYACDSYGMRHD